MKKKVGKRKRKGWRKRSPRCTLCTAIRWMGNIKGRHPMRELKQLQKEKNKKTRELDMTETTLLVLVLLFLVGCFFVVYYYDRKLVKAITAYEIRLDKKGILKRHFSKPLT